ncbi:phosphatase PAP2 family protein [Georgenia sp. AZ-5]|uniref:phosphatase PAP2 family protein n=1 Tax=Georgenia sp. AZ-5 TaxID=3367526 RepID=UPI0037551F4A
MVIQTGPERLSWRRLFGVGLLVASTFGGLTLTTAALTGLPLRDPEGLFGPSYVRLPLIVLGMMALDVLPRVLLRRPGARGLLTATRQVVRERWHGSRLAIVAAGLATFYVAYVAYRNLKSYLPFLRTHLEDTWLLVSDRWLTGGIHPGDLLHELLGTGVAAEVLSFVYMFFLFFVPFSLGLALVWSDHLSRGAWYVNALSFNWIIGTLTYYALPSLGPIYVESFRFADLPETEVSALQRGLWNNRYEVLADPHATLSVHGIAAFASLHVSIVFTAAVVAQLARLPRVVRWAMWLFVVLTALATVYFGWHYLLDVVAGFAVGALAVWLSALAVGWRPGRPLPGREKELPVAAQR